MKKLFCVATLLCFIAIYSCKKHTNNDNTKSLLPIDTAASDPEFSNSELQFLSSIPQQHFVAKDFQLPDGQSLDEYLSENKIIVNDVSGQKKVSAAVNDIFSVERLIKTMIATMGKKADFLTNDLNFPIQDEGVGKPAQSNGLAYVVGSKDHEKRQKSSDHLYYDDAAKKYLKGKCTDQQYGLDCSGFIYQLTTTLPIVLTDKPEAVGNATFFADATKWNAALSAKGYNDIQMVKYPLNSYTEGEFKTGDIVYFGNSTSAYHVAIALLNNDNEMIAFMSLGSGANSCSANSAADRGPIQFKLKDLGPYFHTWGILRFETPEYNKLVSSNASNLPLARRSLAGASAGDVIAFAGGETDGGYTDRVDIYDEPNNRWTTGILSQPRYHLAAAGTGGKILFAGGIPNTGGNSAVVDIYDTYTGKWSVSHLSLARSRLSAAASGNKIFFAGGDSANGYSNRVDIYDVITGRWSVASLSSGRRRMGAASANHKVYFAGGEDGNSQNGGSGIVDIFDVVTGKRSATSLSERRYDLAGAGSGNFIVFAGGGTSATADIFNVVTGQRSTKKLSVERKYDAAAGLGNKIVFAGGNEQVTFADVFDVKTNTWSTLPFRQGRDLNSAAAVNKTIMFAGGLTPAGFSAVVDSYILSK